VAESLCDSVAFIIQKYVVQKHIVQKRSLSKLLVDHPKILAICEKPLIWANLDESHSDSSTKNLSLGAILLL
jgi:hypothetical protein